jgi:hypothetical protein
MRAEALQAAAAAGGPAAELRSRRSAIGGGPGGPGGLGGGGPGGGGGAGGGAGEAQISLTIDVDVQKRKERDEQTTAIEQAISQLDSVFMQVRSLCRLCACIHGLIRARECACNGARVERAQCKSAHLAQRTGEMGNAGFDENHICDTLGIAGQ